MNTIGHDIVTPIDLMDEPDEKVPYDRCVELSWTLAEYAGNERHDGPTTTRLYVVLRCTHHGKREMYDDPEKCYRAVLRFDNSTVGTNFRQTSIHLGGLAGLHICDQPTERYSAKGLRAFAHDMLDAIRAEENAEQVQGWLDRATEAAHESIAAANRQDEYDRENGLGVYS